ncbi:MAG TPA: hypothetical protein VIC34_05995 [Croceibacterium sp.]|jgi:hypothetical protein
MRGKCTCAGLCALAALSMALAWPAPAFAQANDVLGPQAFDGSIDLRGSVAGGETSWLDGGFGKLRYGGDDGETKARAQVASADLAWKPQFSFNLSGLVSVTHQAGQSTAIDLNEAFLSYRSGPAPTRFSARAGAFWPPISEEHGGSTWQVTDSITPSAVNSWVSEEVKVLAFEGKLEHRFAGQQFALTAAVFEHDDMAGTLLSYRGWALHDMRMTVWGHFPLPPLSPSKTAYQDQITNPFWEVDGRAGYYARIDWQTPWPVSVNLFRYDNRGDRLSSYDLQTAWRTRFWNAGAMASLGARTVAKAQVLWGNTQVGPQTPYGYPADVDFAAAYLLLSREFGGGKLTARGDWFKTHDNSFVASDNNNEHGWSTMLAYKHPLTHFADAIVELLHVESDRPARVTNAAIAAEQNQTQLQTSLRLGF